MPEVFLLQILSLMAIGVVALLRACTSQSWGTAILGTLWGVVFGGCFQSPMKPDPWNAFTLTIVGAIIGGICGLATSAGHRLEREKTYRRWSFWFARPKRC